MFYADKKGPKFASVNNGTFICENCVPIHKSLGTRYSIVRALHTEKWNERQMKMLIFGGNEKIRFFLE